MKFLSKLSFLSAAFLIWGENAYSGGALLNDLGRVGPRVLRRVFSCPNLSPLLADGLLAPVRGIHTSSVLRKPLGAMGGDLPALETVIPTRIVSSYQPEPAKPLDPFKGYYESLPKDYYAQVARLTIPNTGC